MRFEQPLIEGTLLRRRQRFQADIKLRCGDEVTAHCAHNGNMTGCSEPGSRVLLSVHADPRRRFRHQIEIVYAGRTPVGIHAGRPSDVLFEAMVQGKITELAGYAQVHRGGRPRKLSHVDLLLDGNGLRPCHISTRSVTLAYDRVAYFPDAVLPRAPQELSELTDLVREGSRAVIFLLVQRADVEGFRPADHIDAEFGQTFRDAVARGVEVLCYRAKIGRKGIELDRRLPVDLGL